MALKLIEEIMYEFTSNNSSWMDQLQVYRISWNYIGFVFHLLIHNKTGRFNTILFAGL
jgi:hypothetical protein